MKEIEELKKKSCDDLNIDFYKGECKRYRQELSELRQSHQKLKEENVKLEQSIVNLKNERYEYWKERNILKDKLKQIKALTNEG